LHNATHPCALVRFASASMGTKAQGLMSASNPPTEPPVVSSKTVDAGHRPATLIAQKAFQVVKNACYKSVIA